jgi:hypothetical protein
MRMNAHPTKQRVTLLQGRHSWRPKNGDHASIQVRMNAHPTKQRVTLL